MKALWSAVGPLAGTIVGFMLGVVSKAVTDRRQAIRAVTRTAGVVLDRLLKLQSASARGDQSVVANELTLLGGDLDRYRDAILASPRHKASHWALYERALPILLEHDLSAMNPLIGELQRMTGMMRPGRS